MIALSGDAKLLADTIGRERTLYLLSKLPRRIYRDKRYPVARAQHTFLYIPKRLTAQHRLITLIGRKYAQKLVDALGGITLQPKTFANAHRELRNIKILELKASGKENIAIAQKLMLSRQLIHQIIHQQSFETNDLC